MSGSATALSSSLRNDHGSLVRYHFPQLAGLVDVFRGQTLIDFVTESKRSDDAVYTPPCIGEEYSTPEGGGLKSPTARYKWIIDNNALVIVQVKPPDASSRGNDRSVFLIEQDATLARLVIRDTMVEKQYVEARNPDGTVASNLLHLRPDHTPVECTGEPFLLRPSVIDDSSLTRERAFCSNLEMDFGGDPWYLLPTGTADGLAGLEDRQNPAQDCASVLQDHFQPFQPYISALQGRTIRQYLQFLIEDTGHSVDIQPPDSRGAVKTKVNTANATVTAEEQSDLSKLKIVLPGEIGNIVLNEGLNGTICITNIQASFTIAEYESGSTVWRHMWNSATQEMYEVTGDSVHFPVTAHRPQGDVHDSSSRLAGS